MDDKVFTEEQLKQAFKKSVLKFNQELVSNKTDLDKILFNKLILNFVGDVLNNLKISYKK